MNDLEKAQIEILKKRVSVMTGKRSAKNSDHIGSVYHLSFTDAGSVFFILRDSEIKDRAVDVFLTIPLDVLRILAEMSLNKALSAKK
jgi:hypothetical protein